MKGTKAARESPPYNDLNGISSGYHVQVSLCTLPSSTWSCVGSDCPAIQVLIPCKVINSDETSKKCSGGVQSRLKPSPRMSTSSELVLCGPLNPLGVRVHSQPGKFWVLPWWMCNLTLWDTQSVASENEEIPFLHKARHESALCSWNTSLSVWHPPMASGSEMFNLYLLSIFSKCEDLDSDIHIPWLACTRLCLLYTNLANRHFECTHTCLLQSNHS